MSKDLPDWVEKWIEDNTRPMKDVDGFVIDAVYVEDLRALLSQYRLCEREAVKYLVSPDNHELPLPLYAEAQEKL